MCLAIACPYLDLVDDQSPVVVEGGRWMKMAVPAVLVVLVVLVVQVVLAVLVVSAPVPVTVAVTIDTVTIKDRRHKL